MGNPGADRNMGKPRVFTYLGFLLTDVGQWFDFVALIISALGATSSDPLRYLWSLVAIFVVTIVFEMTLGVAFAPSGSLVDDLLSAERMSISTRKMYRAVNFVALIIAVTSLIWVQTYADNTDDDLDDDYVQFECNGTSLPTIPYSSPDFSWPDYSWPTNSPTPAPTPFPTVADDDDIDPRCQTENELNQGTTARYVCAVLAVNEGISDAIGLLLGPLVQELLAWCTIPLNVRAKVALHTILLLIVAYAMTLDEFGYVSSGVRLHVQAIVLPAVLCVYLVIAAIVTWPRSWPRKSYTSVKEFWEKSPHTKGFDEEHNIHKETLINVWKKHKPGDCRISYFLRCDEKELERLNDLERPGEGKDKDKVIEKFKNEINDVVEQYDIYKWPNDDAITRCCDIRHKGEIALSLHVISAGNRAPMGCSAPMKFGIFNRYVIERDENGKAASSWCDCSWGRVSRREWPNDDAITTYCDKFRSIIC